MANFRRNAPFFIADAHFNVLLRSPKLDPALLHRCLYALKSFDWSPVDEETVFHHLDAVTTLRIQSLNPSPEPNCVVFIEPISCRISIDEAADRYGLTKRESELLLLIIGSRTTPEIASGLSISPGTVGDHVGNILRKTGTRRRSELVARVLHLEHDSAFIEGTG